jgi:hypothetical protein
MEGISSKKCFIYEANKVMLSLQLQSVKQGSVCLILIYRQVMYG